MARGFAKVYRSLWEGSLGPQWEAWATFVFLLAQADADGTVEVTRDYIRRVSGLPEDVVARGLGVLEAADPASRTHGCDGRRIVRLDQSRDWGWKIVNHSAYRTSDNRERQAEWRERNRLQSREVVTDRNEPSRPVTGCHHTDTDTEADTETEESTPLARSPRKKPAAPVRLPAEGIPGLPTCTNGDWHATAEEVAAWSEAYPAMDVAGTILEMRAWLIANPNRRKTLNGTSRFVNSWLAREQNRA